jgi:hypothetical protein
MAYNIYTFRWDTTSTKDLAKDGLLRSIFDNTKRKAQTFYKELVNDLTTKDEWVKDLQMGGLGEAADLAEGENIPIQGPTLGGTKTYTQARSGTGFRMTEKAERFHKYGPWKRWSADLARTMAETKDVAIHTLFNNPTTTSYGVGFDSTYPLASASHTGLGAGTDGDFDNYLDAALSVSAMEDVRYYFATLKDDMGGLLTADPTHLVYNPDLHYKAKQITQAEYVPFEQSNTPNIVPEMKLKLYEDPRVAAVTAWFVIAKNDKYDVNVFTAQEPDLLIMDAPDTTRDRIATSQQWYSYGFGSARQYFCGNT